MGKRLGIFTKPIHVEKIVNYLNQHAPEINYVISTSKHELAAYDFDVGISYCFPSIIDVDAKPQKPWYNFHPAPLPEYPGMENYAIPIKKKVREFGVTLHMMTMEVDSGEILSVERFRLASEPVSTNELGTIAHYHLFQLFKKTVKKLAHAPKSKAEFDKL